MRKVSLLIMGTAFALLLAGFAGCGGDDDGPTSATATANVTATPEATDNEQTDGPTDTPDSGDGDGDDYYNQLADVLNEADRDSNEIALQYGGPYDDTADEIDQTVSAFNETVDVFESVISSMGDLEPPADAEDAHNTYVANLLSAIELFSAAEADFEDASTEADVVALQDQYTASLNTASSDLEGNCLILQDLADSAGSGADLGCSVQN